MSAASDATTPARAELALALAHDVGKYITRVARNLPEGEVPAVLVEMLVQDLYATDGARTALEVFEARLAEHPEAGPDEAALVAVLNDAREALLRVADLEAGVRAAAPEALREAAALALRVDALFRAWLRELGSEA